MDWEREKSYRKKVDTMTSKEKEKLEKRAIEVLEDKELAKKWLNSSQIGLGGYTPLEYGKTKEGLQKVYDLLGSIEMGVYW